MKEENEFIKLPELGNTLPIATPKSMAKKIHKVRYLSKKLNFFRSAAGAQLFAVIFIFIML